MNKSKIKTLTINKIQKYIHKKIYDKCGKYMVLGLQDAHTVILHRFNIVGMTIIKTMNIKEFENCKLMNGEDVKI